MRAPRIRALRPSRRWAIAIVGATAVAAVPVAAALALPGSQATAKKGGTITVVSAGDVDNIDPGITYYSFGYEITYATQRPLYSYKPGSVAPLPDLAAGKPLISKDGKTVTVHLREGVRFSPPVNREVTSADVKYAIERGFATSVSNGYVGAYFGGIVGAPANATKGVPDIRGIQTPSKYTIVFKLRKPSGVFTGALALPITAPVPAAYAKTFDSRTTSTYGMHQVATGPYMIKNDSSGNISGVGYRPGTLIELVRNPNWNPKTSWRPAYADEILFKEGFQDPTVQTKMVLSGTADVNGDTPPPAAEIQSILSNPSQKAQLVFTPTGGSRYVALNTAKAPFDNADVRKAVAYVLDRNAMRLTRGGAIDGSIASHFIDPSFGKKGFDQAGGFEFNPFASHDNSGNVARAKEMLKKAGFKTGMYTGTQVTQVADNTAPGSNTALVVAADLAKIGFKVKTISVTHATMYTKFCNVPEQEPNICPNVGWLPDFHEPQTILDPTFNGKNIVPVNNSNWPQLNDPAINRQIAAAKVMLDPTLRYAAWGRIDDEVTKTAAAIPWLWESFPSVYSTRVTHAPEVWNGGSPDVTFMAVK
jgi:peptide/nickel transport system substrate-binding protein